MAYGPNGTRHDLLFNMRGVCNNDYDPSDNSDYDIDVDNDDTDVMYLILIRMKIVPERK